MRSQFTADIAACAMSEHEAEGIDNSHQGEHDSCSTADTGSELAYKEGICHIVYTGHKHTHCVWKSKLQYQFVDGVFVILSYCICALSVFIICIPLYISVGNRIKGPPVIYFIIERPFEKRFYTVQLKKVYFVFT